LLGEGINLFDGIGTDWKDLEPTRTVTYDGVNHLYYRFTKLVRAHPTEAVDRVGHPLDGLGEYRRRGGEVEPDVSGPARAEDVTGAQRHPGAVEEEPGRTGEVGDDSGRGVGGGIVQTQRPAVQPRQIRPLRRPVAELGKPRRQQF